MFRPLVADVLLRGAMVPPEGSEYRWCARHRRSRHRQPSSEARQRAWAREPG